jgi:thiaminase/transcriptional activator TenA
VSSASAPSGSRRPGPPRLAPAIATFLLAPAYQHPFQVAAAALLPCFQIYHEVGKHLHRIAGCPNLYQRWIDTYRDEAFGEAVRQVLAHTDDAFAGSAEATRMLMRESYLKAVRYEWMFWDSAYRMEAWPI